MTKGITCPECKGHGFIDKHEIREDLGPDTAISTMTEEVCPRCHGTGCVLVPVTNGDRIRAMTDEEMAMKLLRATLGEVDAFCRNLPKCKELVEQGKLPPDSMCADCVLEWLRKPAEE